MKRVDPFYRTAEWRQLREVVLLRDLFRCAAPGCTAVATRVDHIVSRRAGGADHPDNLRSLCASCDNAVKEGPDGKRRSGGKLRAIGCDAQGRPRDPSHWWNA